MITNIVAVVVVAVALLFVHEDTVHNLCCLVPALVTAFSQMIQQVHHLVNNLSLKLAYCAGDTGLTFKTSIHKARGSW